MHQDENFQWNSSVKASAMVTGRTSSKFDLASLLMRKQAHEPLIFKLLDNFTSAVTNSTHNNFEDTNILTYALFTNPGILDAATSAPLVYGTPHHNERPVAFFDGAFQNPRMMLYLQENCSAVNTTGLDGPTHCAQLELSQETSRKEMNERQYCGFPKAAITAQVDCRKYGLFEEFAAAWDFGESSKESFDVTIAYNDTALRRDGRDQGPDWQNRVTESINMATQAFVKYALGEEHFVRLRALRDMPREKSSLELDFASLLGPAMYVLLFQIPAPAMLVTLVSEKENKILTRMKMQGMSPLSHYIGTYLWNLALFDCFLVITLVSGIAVFQLKFFTLSDIGLLIVFLLLYGNLQIAFVFLLAHVFKKSKSASVTSNLWLMLSGYLCGTLFAPLMAKDHWYMILLEFIPTLGLFRGLYEFAEYSFLANYTGGKGLSFSNFSDDKNGMETVLLIFFFEWILFVVAGVLAHDESYWYKFLDAVSFGAESRRRQKFIELSDMNRGAKVSSAQVKPEDISTEVQAEDVAQERIKVRELMESENRGNAPILACNLKKVYKVGATKKVAVNGVDLGVEDGECIGLLGPNGAGKTTLINMLVGFVEPTEGEAFIGNYNIRHDKHKIFESLGVCPQFDVLWPELTANQHLLFYGRIKGLQGFELEEAVDQALHSVNLYDVKYKKSGTYSGGMKRRLSVAISLIGKPKVVFLDEPTTGLDPASRRELWKTISKAREYAAVVLTTHSMEEAEALCDRVGIFVDGQMRCIGTPSDLTTKFGEYILLTTSKSDSKTEEDIQQFVGANLSASLKEVYSFNGIQKFELPTRDVEYSVIFSKMNKAQQEDLIADWGVSTPSLEDVFLRVAAEFMDFM